MLVVGSLSGTLVMLMIAAMYWGVWRFSDYTPTADRHIGGPSRGGHCNDGPPGNGVVS